MKNSIRDFFETHIVPLHEVAGKNAQSFLELDTDESKETYFSSPVHPQYHDLNTISIDTEKKMLEFLHEFWNDRPELTAMIPDLVKLAYNLKNIDKEEDTELSPFVYAMY